MNFLKKSLSTILCCALTVNSLGLSSIIANATESNSKEYVYDGYKINYDVTNSWGNTEVVSVTLSNTGDSTIENWMLYFDPNGQVHDTVNIQEAQTSDGITYFRNSGYNANVNPNSSVSFSYMIDDCEAMPDDFTLCQTRANKESGYQVSLQVNQTWGDSFNGNIIIQNDTDKSIEAWELTVDTNFTITEITNSWAATVTELEPYKYMLKGTYTSVIPAGGSVSLGFNGVREGNPIISDYSLTEVVVDESLINNFNWSNWEDMLDTDGDGIPDEIEEEIGTDPLNSDTDGDGVPDRYELLTIGSDPTDANSLDSDISDGEYDNDQDGLSNYEEYLLGTDPLCADSDYDGLSDGDEVIYGTDPLNPDTDDDGLSDGDEIALGLNPLVSDTDSDGIPDNEEMFNQSKTFDGDEDDTVVKQIDVAFEGTGYINSTTSVKSVMDVDWMCSNVVGLIGDPYDISSDSKITEGTITFHVATESLGESSFDDLIVLWYNEANQHFEKVKTVSDNEESTLTATVTHFSKYLIVDCDRWYEAWNMNYYPSNNIDLHTAITIDCSSSMNRNDPNRCRVDAAKGFVNAMHGNDMASVTLFANHVSAQSLGTLTKDKKLLKEKIDNVTSLGVTNYEEALQHSIKSLDTNNNTYSENIIIFLSDGYPTNDSGYAIDPSDFDYSVVDTAAAAGIKIYTIGLTNNVCETVLKEMAYRTGGEYFYANTAEELVSYFLNINVTEKYDTTTDTDGDGIPDLFEAYGMPVANGQVLFSDPGVVDTDGDGLEDGEEVSVMYVNDDANAKLAAEYILEYYPDIEVNECGGIYFKMISDPENTDTDGDHDHDNADPDPMSYQLNGYFSNKMGELWEYCNNFSNKKFSTDWYCFFYLRDIGGYNDTLWLNSAGNDSSFKGYITNLKKNDPTFVELAEYFESFYPKNNCLYWLYENDSNYIDLYHYSAVESSLLYNGKIDYESRYSYAPAAFNHMMTIMNRDYGFDCSGIKDRYKADNQVINDMTGWAGDLTTLMIDAKHVQSDVISTDYDITDINNDTQISIYDIFYTLLGKKEFSFSYEDLYADIMAVNLVTDCQSSVEFVNGFNSYFSNNNRYSFFANTLTYDVIFYYASNAYSTFNWSKYGVTSCLWDCKLKNCTVSKKGNCSKQHHNFTMNEVSEVCEAFVDFMNDNFNINITPQNSLIEYADGYDSSYIITTPKDYAKKIVSASKNVSDVADQLDMIYEKIH